MDEGFKTCESTIDETCDDVREVGCDEAAEGVCGAIVEAAGCAIEAGETPILKRTRSTFLSSAAIRCSMDPDSLMFTPW